jgi:uncharacterized protein YjbI with pentapeptide repeats
LSTPTPHTPPGDHDHFDLTFNGAVDVVLVEATFENCVFKEVNLADSSLKYSVFQECRFVDCDLSRAKLNGAAFRDCSFERCRMMGMDWSAIGGLVFSIKMTECKARYSVFDALTLKWCGFSQTDLSECSFQECDLTGVRFDGCDLTRSQFTRAKLIRTHLAGATGVSLAPNSATFKATIINLDAAVALLAAQGVIIE